jgi:hypothetical protein
MVLTLVEHQDGQADELSLQALALARDLAAGAARERPLSMETLGLAGRLGSDLGFEANRRGRAPASRSGAFVYRKGRYIPLSAIPGATFATLTVAINNRGETAGTSVDAAPGNDGQLPPGSVKGFVRNRRGDSTKFNGPRGGRVAVFGLNNRGQTAGTYVDAGAVPGPPASFRPARCTASSAIGTTDRGLRRPLPLFACNL